MQTITIIIGLPGSGKTTYIKNNLSDLSNTMICDDYHKSTPSNSHNFIDSLYYSDLKKALSTNKNIVLSDIAWCKKDRRDLLLSEINRIIDELRIDPQIEFIYFENNPTACKNNVIKRGRNDRVERELGYIDKWSKEYTIPNDCQIISIVN